MTGIYCSNSIYEYDGWLFEVHRYLGAHPLNKDYSPKARVGKKFWTMWDKWSKLTPEQKKQHIHYSGGCKAF